MLFRSPPLAAPATDVGSAPQPADVPAGTDNAPAPAPELKTVLAPSPVDVAKPVDVTKPVDAPQPQTPAATTRYLVVPERIALQADTSFVNPAPAEGTIDEPQPADQQATQQQATQQQSRAATQPKPGTKPQQVGRPQSGRPQTGRATERGGPTVRPSAVQRPTGGAVQQPATKPLPAGKRPTPTSTSASKPMFPNIAAGIDALTGGWKRTRDGQTDTRPQ